MSGIVGLFNLDDRPADARVAARMLHAIAHRGPDRSAVWSDGPVALGHGLLTTTPESVGERQPHAFADAGVCIVFDGRLDNRDELLDAFARARLAPTAPFDAAFALCAYRCWGDECAARLLGDFALAIWDAPRRRLFCARDILGIKALYYHHGPGVFLFASEPQALLAHPAVSRRPNEGMVAEHLSVVTSRTETLLADVQRLAPASRLIVSRDRCRVDTYWTLDGAREIRYKTDAEYAEHLRSILSEAVRVRLRSASGVGVMLSGGVDSSSILGLATALERQGAADTACGAWSLVAGREVLDERPFIAEVVTMNNCRAHVFSGDTLPAGDYRREAARRGDLPPAPNARLACTLFQHAAAAGTRVLLMGFWSDEFFSGSPIDGADLFRSFRWLALARRRRAQAALPEVWARGSLAKELLWPLIPRLWRKRIKIAIGRDGVPPWVCRRFAERVSLPDRLYPLDGAPSFPTLAQEDIYRDAMSGRCILDTEEDDRGPAEFGVETRHPFADRRVMEFAFAIPEDLRCRNGVRKFVLREAVRDHLPQRVGQRLTSADGSSIFIAPMRELVESGLLDAPAIERHGWVDAGAVRRLYDKVMSRHASGDSGYVVDIWPLWKILAVETWMQHVVEDSSAEEAQCAEMTIA